jgi:D-sedoheptulose 7-phosphate isomerase
VAGLARTGLDDLLARRARASEGLCTPATGERIAALCEAMAERFAGGGRLVAIGRGAQAMSDARHVAVEFVHPVIVGKRALPALAVEEADWARDEPRWESGDIVAAFGVDGEVVAAARADGCLTIAFASCGAKWELVPPGEDPFVSQELAETIYHVLWELVHVFLEHRAPALYSFLEAEPSDVHADVARSALAKIDDAAELRARVLSESRDELAAAARAIASGGTLLALGNGGSATDAMDVVADFRAAPQGWAPRRALDLTADPAILTAIANDVGVEAIFARQVIAYGRPGDVLIAISTSGGSANVLAALQEARRRRLATIALVGYDGGRIAADALADHVIVAPSQHIPRIQEAQATAYHALRELVA